MALVFEEETLRSLSSKTVNRLEMWTDIVRQSGAKNVVEIGVWKGDFAAHMLQHCSEIEHYAMIDPWATLPDWNKPFNVDTQVFEEVYDEAMSKTAFAQAKIEVLRGTTLAMIDRIPDNSLDFAYIDGDHTLRGITLDLVKLLPKMKHGGLIAGDDFVANPWQHSLEFEPTMVCPFSIYFAEAMDLPIWGLPHQQFLIVNSQERGFAFTDLCGDYQDISLNKAPPKAKKRGLMSRLGLR